MKTSLNKVCNLKGNTYFPLEKLKLLSISCLTKVGASEKNACEVADVLALADVKGKDSHGIARLRRYVDGLAEGKISKIESLKIIKESPGSILLDAQNGLGQPASIFAMNKAIHKAKQNGIGIAAVRNSNHFGIAGYYVDLACQKNMIGIAFSNASPQVAPTFGAESMFGTNPLAIGLPTHPTAPFLLDMATSIVSRGRLERLQWERTEMSKGWILDQTGIYNESLSEIISGLKSRSRYSLLPLGGSDEKTGGHKGYSLALFIDLMCGPLFGGSWGRHVYGKGGANLGQCFISINPEMFVGLSDFQKNAQQAIFEIQAAKKSENQDRIYYPGEQSFELSERRRKEGILLSDIVIEDLFQLCKTYEVPFPL